jgi:alkylation response protein AidB-like acyl-CoA dehydrogenase
MTPAGLTLPITQGGAFLLESRAPGEIFTAEDLTEQHRAIARMVEEFWMREVEPNLDAIQHREPGAAREVLQKAADLGLMGIAIPEKFGGMELDLVSDLVVTEILGRDASYSGWHAGHTGIGTLPILYFGTEQQQAKYLPKLARMEMLAAYALSEPQAGSDALAARTRADLSPDGKSYLLNGQKMWITTGGAADLFTVFAKIGGEKFTAFLVERAFGVTSGAEEHKMGLKGSSTTPLYFDNVPVPVENLLGEIGRGHIIALNVLNIGRLKLAAGALGGAKAVLAASLKYAKDRRAFGSSIAEFGAIRHKLAEMAIRIFATESIAWRIAGQIEARGATPKAAEEFAVECSMAKVFGSEMLGYVADEGVAIHGGYGYHQDYFVERAYRDARIYRIFEGTNEINRLVITGMLLKRAARGQIALPEAVDRSLTAAAQYGRDPEFRLVLNAKELALWVLGLAQRKFGDTLDKQQEVLMHIADILTETFTMESVLLRTQKIAASREDNIASEICSVFLYDAMARVQFAARQVIGACSEPDRIRAGDEPIDTVNPRRKIAARLLERERYALW